MGVGFGISIMAMIQAEVVAAAASTLRTEYEKATATELARLQELNKSYAHETESMLIDIAIISGKLELLKVYKEKSQVAKVNYPRTR